MEDDPTRSPLADLEPVAPQSRRKPIIWVLSVVVISALIVGAIAVSGSHTKTFPTTVVLSQAAARTTKSGTAHVALSAIVTLDGNTTTVFGGEGDFDFGSGDSALTLRVGAVSGQVRSVDHIAYIALPGMKLPRGAHWLSLSASDIKLDPKAAAFTSNNPASGLQFLSAVNGNPRVVDHETVDGADVTHYAFTLDLNAILEQTSKAADALKSSSFGRSINALKSLVDLSKIPGEAWIDNDGRVRKFDITVQVDQGGQSGKVVDQFLFSRFDEPVSVPAPPPSDTVSFREAPNVFSTAGG